MTLLTNEDLDRVAADIPHVRAWLKAVETQIQSAIEDGAEFKNVSLVPTQAQRKWAEGVDPLKVLRRLRMKLDVIAPRKALSPAEAEKKLGKPIYAEKLAQHVTKQSSGVKLAYANPED